VAWGRNRWTRARAALDRRSACFIAKDSNGKRGRSSISKTSPAGGRTVTDVTRLIALVRYMVEEDRSPSIFRWRS
jgi:hypothetical protein